MNKKRIFYLDFIRAVAAFIIVSCHISAGFQYSSKTNALFLYDTVNKGGWGPVAVTIFFVLSGASLMIKKQNFGSISEVALFYKGRIKTIFSIYLPTYIVCYFAMSIYKKTFFWGGEPEKLILSLTAFDGYFNYLLRSSYYLIGEWYLGAQLILYFLFPLLRILQQRIAKITSVIICILYFSNLIFLPFRISITRNILSCLFAFWIGMNWFWLEKWLKSKNYYSKLVIMAITGLVCGVTGLYYFPILSYFFLNVFSFSLMCILAVVGKCLENSCPAFILLIFSKAAESSFAVFLTHHFIIDGTVNQIAELIPNKYLILTLFTICYAIVLYILGYLWNRILKNLRYMFKRRSK